MHWPHLSISGICAYIHQYKYALRPMLQNCVDEWLIFHKLIVWCHQTNSRKMTQHWGSSVTKIGVTMCQILACLYIENTLSVHLCTWISNSKSSNWEFTCIDVHTLLSNNIVRCRCVSHCNILACLDIAGTSRLLSAIALQVICNCSSLDRQHLLDDDRMIDTMQMVFSKLIGWLQIMMNICQHCCSRYAWLKSISCVWDFEIKSAIVSHGK